MHTLVFRFETHFEKYSGQTHEETNHDQKMILFCICVHILFIHPLAVEKPREKIAP